MTQLCRHCPKCGSTKVRSTLKTVWGSYCHCSECEHAWHDDAEQSELERSFA